MEQRLGNRFLPGLSTSSSKRCTSWHSESTSSSWRCTSWQRSASGPTKATTGGHRGAPQAIPGVPLLGEQPSNGVPRVEQEQAMGNSSRGRTPKQPPRTPQNPPACGPLIRMVHSRGPPMGPLQQHPWADPEPPHTYAPRKEEINVTTPMVIQKGDTHKEGLQGDFGQPMPRDMGLSVQKWTTHVT